MLVLVGSLITIPMVLAHDENREPGNNERTEAVTIDCEGDVEAPSVDYAVVKPFQTYQNPLRRVGWFRLLIDDNCDPDALIYIGDSAGGFVAGPFHNGDQVEIAKGPSLTPGQSVPPPGSPNVARIRLRGGARMFGVDGEGNTSLFKKIL